MNRSSDEQSTSGLSEDQFESGRLKRLRLRQMRRDARARAAQAQKAAAEVAERTARYTLWSVILSAIFAMITAAAVGYAIFSDLIHIAAL